MPEDAKGLASAVAQTVTKDPPAETAAAEQLGLPEIGAPDARGAGRPPGAINRATRDWVDFLTEQYGSPLERLMRTATAPLEELAERLGVSIAKAFEVQQAAQVAALPYMHQKQPQALQVEGGKVVYLTINDGGEAQAGPVEEADYVMVEDAGKSEG